MHQNQNENNFFLTIITGINNYRCVHVKHHNIWVFLNEHPKRSNVNSVKENLSMDNKWLTTNLSTGAQKRTQT